MHKFTIVELGQRLLLPFSQPALHTFLVSLYDTVSFTHFALQHADESIHTHTRVLKRGSWQVLQRFEARWRLSHILLASPHSPQTGRVRSLPFCSLPASSVLSVVTEWHVHSCLLPPAAAYSKAHTSPSSQRFNFCHFNFLFRVGFGRLCHAYAVHKVDLLNNCSKQPWRTFTAHVWTE